MRRYLTSCFIALMAGFLLSRPLLAVEIGTARVNVLQELGQPISAIGRGDTEVLTYKNGVRIQLRNKRVVEMTGLTPAAPAAQKTVAPLPLPTADPVEPAPTKAQLGEFEKMEKEQADADAKARAQMEKAIMGMEAEHDRPPPGPPPFNVLGFAIELGIKWILTLAALKLSCKYWNSEVFWSGLMTVAIVDVAIRGAIGFIGFKLMHMMSLLYADEAVASVVMVLLLRKVSINQRMSLAVEVVLTTKTFSIVVGSFLVTVLLRVMA